MRTLRALVGGIVLAASCATAWVLACGPFTTEMSPVTSVVPADGSAYASGEIGVVRPRFARQYLFVAYRVLNGQATSARLGERLFGQPSSARSATELRREILGPAGPSDHFNITKFGPNYVAIYNCTRGALETALRTREERVKQFGATSIEVREWTRGQAAVFENCSGPDLVLPPDLPPGIDPVIRADHTYQTAAAFFYAMQYEEAAKRFTAIAADASSPWKRYGRYLAARAKIRQGTVFDDDKARSAKLLAEATTELNDVLRDEEASSLHESARGLLNFIKARTDPVDRVREVSAILTASTEPRPADVIDYVLVMNRLLGDTVSYEYGGIPDRASIAATSDLNDWVLAMQGGGDDASERALARWKETKTLPWLVAALWKVPPSHAAAGELLDAAARVSSDSPAYASVAFLRVRLLVQRGDRAGARALLATLPVQPRRGFSRESINLVRAERLQLADSLDDVLVNAPRFVVSESEGSDFDRPVFDEDGAAIFDHGLPLRRLVEASLSPVLPPRLRLRVAMAAFARSVVLRRHDEALRVAPVLRDLAPVLASDLDVYVKARDSDERHRAGIILLLRTPGISGRIKGGEDDVELKRDQPARAFDHLFKENWWCAAAAYVPPQSVVTEALYRDKPISFPDFLANDEPAAADKELTAFGAVGSAKKYLASEAVSWAKARPTDPTAAEALALAVDGWRWSCWDDANWPIVRTAFQALHRQFPNSEWARKTKYWFKY